eukprot:Lithocolla_globosa_v1_NODE_5359_length_1253_cov_21602.800667.p4 type:complete len:137 gc:universal NODE_5359_length_1253_cov_21602.800667:814-1224(+)
MDRGLEHVLLGFALFIEGKCNGVVINKCVGVGCVADEIISVSEVLNSKKTTFQAKVSMPSCTIDKSENTKVYVPKASLADFKVFTSQATTSNIYTPKESDPEDYEESPLPEMLQHTYSSEKSKAQKHMFKSSVHEG